MTTYKREEVLAASLKYFNGDKLAADVWIKKYALKQDDDNFFELSPSDMHVRLAKEFSAAEDKYKDEFNEDLSDYGKKRTRLTFEKIFNYFNNFKYISPQGSIMSMLGNNNSIGSLSNCVVLPRIFDSYGGIMFADQQLTQLFKRRAGVGLDISTLRPSESKVTNAAGTSTGAVSFMERFSNTTREVGQNNRRGALIITIDVRHPDVFYFVKIKRDLTKVTGANISVMLRDDFMEAVVKNDKYTLQFPVDVPIDKADIVREINAIDLWNEIINSAHSCAEPGLLFKDRQHLYSTSSIYPNWENITCNPCLSGKEKLLTVDGYKTFEELCDVENINIINSQGNIVETRVWRSGEKDTIKLINSLKEEIICTPNHRWMTIDDDDVEAINLLGKKIKPFLFNNYRQHDSLFVKLGFIQGDGNLSRLNSLTHKGFEINIGVNDEDVLHYFGFVREKQSQRAFYVNEFSSICHDLKFEAKILPERNLPLSINEWSENNVISFISGMFSANGSVVRNRITYKSTNKTLILQLQAVLSTLGIYSYYTTNKSKKIKFENGDYTCKESYDLNIGRHNDLVTFYNRIGFIQKYKNDKLMSSIIQHTPKITKIIDNGVISVYDFVEPENHWGVVSGYISHNCSEIVMNDDSCRLMVVNYLGCVVDPFTPNAKFDFDKLYEISYEAQRLLDDLVDLELSAVSRIIYKVKSDPEPDYIKSVELQTWENLYEKGKEGRRTGLGFTGLGDVFASLGLKYDSDEAMNLLFKISETKFLGEFDSSIDMAIQRGKFSDFNKKYEDKSEFINMIEKEYPTLYNRMMKYGRRNISISTVAPTGSLSILTQTTSGIEPLFMVGYKRRKKINPTEKGVKVDFVDAMGDSWSEFDVLHPQITNWMEINNLTDVEKAYIDNPYIGSTAPDIDWIKRIKIQSIVQKFVTHSISSTINLPKDVSQKKVGEIYLEAWKHGLKGITVYRDGSRTGVLISSDASTTGRGDVLFKSNAPKRPNKLKCDIHHITAKGQQWVVLVGMMNGGDNPLTPYEVFSFKKKSIDISQKITSGTLIKVKSGHYKLETEFVSFDDITKLFEQDEEEALTRMISISLRHGVDIKYIVEQLNKSEGTVASFSKAIARALKKYISDDTEVKEKCPECGGKLLYSEGCVKCIDCSYSKC